MAASIFLRQSNVKLQEELRKTNNSYTEEKTVLRSHLSGLRLDLSELHHDNRTITTVDDSHSRSGGATSHSHSCSEHELKRLADFDVDSGRSWQLPSLRHLNTSPRKNEVYGHHHHHHKKDSGDNTARSGKTLRFIGNDDWDNHHNTDKQESQKFLELQKNQEVLRNIGRANFKEKRHSLIRLPTISSAKKRNKLWDSGNNVSRPKGQSTSFEQNLKLYVEDSIVLSKPAFDIPTIKDSQRSEIQLSRRGKRPPFGKRKVQFTRPRPEDYSPRERDYQRDNLLDNSSSTEASSLNTTLADVSLEDNTLGNITFDEEAFNKQLATVKHDQIHSSTTKSDNNNNNNNSNKRLNQSNTSSLQTIDETGDSSTNVNPVKSCLTNTTNTNINNNNKGDPQTTTLPPIKIKTLAKKNLILHDNLNNMRTSPTNTSTNTSFPKLRLSPETRSTKDSDRSVGTKLSRMSQETESWKSTYTRFVDPERRNKTLTEIMFAVRSRMRENEETIRFGEAPRRQDKTLSDMLLGNTPRNIASPRWSDATQSPRKGKVSKRGRPTIPPTKAEKSNQRTDSTAHLQGYLRKMVRQKRVPETEQPSPRRNKTIGQQQHQHHRRPAPMHIHKQPQLIAQQA